MSLKRFFKENSMVLLTVVSGVENAMCSESPDHDLTTTVMRTVSFFTTLVSLYMAYRQHEYYEYFREMADEGEKAAEGFLLPLEEKDNNPTLIP